MAPSITAAAAAADACSSKEKETNVTQIPNDRRRGDARLKIEKELLQDAGEMQRSQQTAGCYTVRADRVLQAPPAGKKSISIVQGQSQQPAGNKAMANRDGNDPSIARNLSIGSSWCTRRDLVNK
uniref:uncharacterized protein LOC117600427 isoform X1 n=1 Tax=Osmia lignaria TaxID=473952 RepID=UPI001478709A|nr:uncharacterized protein LOC117600427 isoform X1 [Osmia lignaria]